MTDHDQSLTLIDNGDLSDPSPSPGGLRSRYRGGGPEVWERRFERDSRLPSRAAGGCSADGKGDVSPWREAPLSGQVFGFPRLPIRLRFESSD